MPKSNLKEIESFEQEPSGEQAEQAPQALTSDDLRPQAGNTNLDRIAHLRGFVKAAAGRWPNMPRRKTFASGDVLDAQTAHVLNMRTAHSAGSQASKASSFDEALAKTNAYVLSGDEWNYADEVTDAFVRALMSAAGVKDAAMGTRDDRRPLRNAVLLKEEDMVYPSKDGSPLLDKGMSFVAFVESFIFEDTGAPEEVSKPSSNGKAKRGFAIG